MNLPLNDHEAQCARAAFAAMMQHYIEQAEKAQAGVPLRYFSRDQAHTYLDLIRKLDTATDDYSDQTVGAVPPTAGTQPGRGAGRSPARQSVSRSRAPDRLSAGSNVRATDSPHEVVLPWSHVSESTSG